MGRVRKNAPLDKFAYNKHLEVAKKMPPLYHKLPGEEFDIAKSEVVKWLITQPEIMQFIMDRVANRAEASRLITYDPDTGKWQGVEYD